MIRSDISGLGATPTVTLGGVLAADVAPINPSARTKPVTVTINLRMLLSFL
jgi:hypothetical protein